MGMRERRSASRGIRVSQMSGKEVDNGKVQLARRVPGRHLGDPLFIQGAHVRIHLAQELQGAPELGARPSGDFAAEAPRRLEEGSRSTRHLGCWAHRTEEVQIVTHRCYQLW